MTRPAPTPRHRAPAAAPVLLAPVLLALLLAGCDAGSGGLVSGAERPDGAPPGTCWGKTAIPARIETVTEHVLEAPAAYAPDGTLVRAAQYRTERRQDIVEERRETWFETPCPDDLTPDFISSLQRALKARGAYSGPVTGRMDAATRAALRSWQKARGGPDSDKLSLETARGLGLVAVPRETPEEG